MEGATIHLAARTKSQMEEVSDPSCMLVLFGHHLQTQPPFSVRESLVHGHSRLRLLYAARPELAQAVSHGYCTLLVALCRQTLAIRAILQAQALPSSQLIDAVSRMQPDFSLSSPGPLSSLCHAVCAWPVHIPVSIELQLHSGKGSCFLPLSEGGCLFYRWPDAARPRGQLTFWFIQSTSQMSQPSISWPRPCRSAIRCAVQLASFHTWMPGGSVGAGC